MNENNLLVTSMKQTSYEATKLFHLLAVPTLERFVPPKAKKRFISRNKLGLDK